MCTHAFGLPVLPVVNFQMAMLSEVVDADCEVA